MIAPMPAAAEQRSVPDDPVAAGWSLAAGAVALVLYLALVPRVQGDGDSAELTLALAVGGIPHPPGYPLYVLLGHAWVTILHATGIGWAWAANAWSAMAAGTAVGLLHAVAARLIPGSELPSSRARALAALLPTGLFALHPGWLAVATVAEVYAAHLAILAALTLTALALVRGASAGPPRSLAFAFGALAGAGLAHHLTSVFFSLPLAAAALSSRLDVRRRSGLLAAMVGGAAFPLAAHGFTAWRAAHPAEFQWPLLEPGLSGLLAHAGGSVFAVFFGHFAPAPEARRALASTILPFAVPGFAALVAAWAIRRDEARPVLGALLVAAALQAGFALVYGIPDLAPYGLPVLLVAVVGFIAFAGAAPGRIPAVALAPVTAGLLVAGALWVSGGLAARGRLEALDAAVLARWHAIPFERGIVLWTSDRYLRLRSRQILEGEHPGRIVENPAMLTWARPRREFERRLGFDPIAGLTLRDDSDLPRIAPNIARQTRLPVLDFERGRP